MTPDIEELKYTFSYLFYFLFSFNFSRVTNDFRFSFVRREPVLVLKGLSF